MDTTLIAEIKDGEHNVDKWHIRKASRGILRNGNKIALLDVSLLKYHKLPGGGSEENETNEEAFNREILEETGYKCKIKNYGGVVIEYRTKFELVQISYIYLADVIGKAGKTNLMPDEIEEGYILQWVTIDEAIEILKNDSPQNYEGGFIRQRDLAVLNFYKKGPDLS